MSIRSPVGASASESYYDPSPDCISYSFSHQAEISIDKWREDIPGPAFAGQDFLFSDLPDLNASDASDLKDTASVLSMESGYHSQSSGASRRRTEDLVAQQAQDGQNRMSNQFVNNEWASPAISSISQYTFQETQDMGPIQMPPVAGHMEAGDGTFAFTNYSMGQEYPQMATSNLSRYPSSSAIDSRYQYGAVEEDAFNPAFTTYPSDIILPAQIPPQHRLQASRPRIDTSARPAPPRSSSSFTSAHDMRRMSAKSTGYGPFTASPTIDFSTHMPQSAGFDQSHLDNRTENDESVSASLPTHSIVDEEEGLSPSDVADARNQEEELSKKAREHPLYKAEQDKDGKFHCPWVSKGVCTHKPTSLKCNYDKYVDSHLKPFKCRQKSCVDIQFSSTACLLRHEREAHGMHGHGSRPHLCHFTDCDRSQVGNGFPRRYNLFDHMKRVHDYSGPASESSPPAAPGQSHGARKPNPKKRKSTAEEPAEKRQKTSKAAIQQQQVEQRRARLQKDFMSQKQNLIDMLTGLSSPSDLKDDIPFSKVLVNLREISTKYKQSLGG